jgi:hypothetical protein
MNPNPRTIAGGLAAAVLGSGVTAALLLAPDATSASTPTSTEVPSTDDSDGADGTSARGDALREALQPLVDGGALTEEQADAIVDELLDVAVSRFDLEIGPDVLIGRGFPGLPALPGMPGGHHENGPFGGRLRLLNADVIADAIGIDVADLIDQLRQGQTVAEIAEDNGVDPQAVIAALVDEYSERVTDWVNGDDSGATTDDEAATTTPPTTAEA